MIAEIIAIGSELTTGAKLDTNSQWLSTELAAAGIPTRFHATVADDLEAMVEVFRQGVNRSDILLITGGLGPTLDDLTRQALADLVQVDLYQDDASLEFIQSLFQRRDREMPRRNVIQAQFPEGSRPIPNERGTAPGIWMEVPRKDFDHPCHIAAMPGVPSEMKPMFLEKVLPRLPGTGRVIRRARINCFGVGESHAEEILGELTARGREPEVGITAHEATITLRITANDINIEACERKIAETRAIIHQKMTTLVFGEEDDELEHVVVRQLAARGAAVAVVESTTGGLLAHRLSQAAGTESCFVGGIVVPNRVAWNMFLKNPADDLVTTNANAEQAELVASICRRFFDSDFAIAIVDQISSYNDESLSDDVPTMFAIAGRDFTKSGELSRVGDPAIHKSRAVKAGLNALRLHLIQDDTTT